MAIERISKDWQADPWNATTDTVSSMHIQSTHYGGNFEAITAPSTANFPDALAGTPSRYFVNLPLSIDVTDLAGAKPIAIYDNDSSATLTRVTGAPAANQYRVPVTASERNNAIEINAAQAGNELEFDFYGMNTVMDADAYDYFRNDIYDFKACSSDYAITDTDGYQIFQCSSSDTRSTITLPSLANNPGRIVQVYNKVDGVTRILRAGSDTINDGENDATEINLYARGDNITLRAMSDEWYVEKLNSTIETGWVNRSDWTNVHLGTVTINVDGGSSGDLGYTVGEGVSSSNAGGRIIDITDNADGTGVLIVYSVTGGGSFINNAPITGDNSSASAVVNGATKNVDSNFYHGSGLNIRDYKYKLLISTDATDNNSFDTFTSAGDNSAAARSLGTQIYQVDTNNFYGQTGATGVLRNSTTGSGEYIDAEDWYYKLIYERII